jgi:hypothetical protein
MHTAEVPQIGSLVPDGENRRDAVHVAIAPVIASEDLVPGQHVGLDGGRPTHAWARANTKIGIVDPFLAEPVKRGQRFWLFLYPGTITSLRHVWTHPAFTARPAGAVPARTSDPYVE